MSRSGLFILVVTTEKSQAVGGFTLEKVDGNRVSVLGVRPPPGLDLWSGGGVGVGSSLLRAAPEACHHLTKASDSNSMGAF